ncbi:MAG: hypothetical protein ABIU29_00055, partial [Chthoniobacterales bacterium]
MQRLIFLLPIFVATTMAGIASASDKTARPPTNLCGELSLPPSPDSIDRVVVGVMREKHIPGLSLAVVRKGHADKV